MREPDQLSVALADEAATRSAGAALAAALDAAGPGRAFVTLAGELGSGKTTLVRGLLGALGVDGAIRSPTFTLVESYPAGERTVHHLDWYRLAASELDTLGFRDLLAPGQWVLVEWPERAPGVASEADLALTLAYEGGGRRLEMRALTEFGRRTLSHLGRAIA